MKYVVIGRLAPGVDNTRKALEVFMKAGLAPGTEATWAGTDGKTFINVIDTDAPDMTTAATYAPFFGRPLSSRLSLSMTRGWRRSRLPK